MSKESAEQTEALQNGAKPSKTQEPAPLTANDLVVILGALQNNRYTFDEHERVIRPLVYKVHSLLADLQEQ